MEFSVKAKFTTFVLFGALFPGDGLREAVTHALWGHAW